MGDSLALLMYEAELMWIEARGTPQEREAWNFWQAMAAIGRQTSFAQGSGSDTANSARRDNRARFDHAM